MLENDTEAFFLALQKQNVDVRREYLLNQTHNTLLLQGAMSDGIDPTELMVSLLDNP